MLAQNFTQRFFMVDWIDTILYFLPNILIELFSKTTNFSLPHSVRLPKLSYTLQLFSFFSCLLSTSCGHAQDIQVELELKDSLYRQEFAQNKQKELDSLRAFYARQHTSVAHKVRTEPIPKVESRSYLSVCYNFICEHYIISTIVLLFFLFVLGKAILYYLWIVLNFFKEQLNRWFNALPKSLQRFFRKQRRKFQEVWDFILKSRDGIL